MRPVSKEEWRELFADESLQYSDIALLTERRIKTVIEWAKRLGCAAERSPHRTRYTPELIERALELRRAGTTYQGIAAILGVAPRYLRKVLRFHGAPPVGRPSSFYENIFDEVQRLRAEGWSWVRLSKHFGCPKSSLPTSTARIEWRGKTTPKPHSPP